LKKKANDILLPAIRAAGDSVSLRLLLELGESSQVDEEILHKFFFNNISFDTLRVFPYLSKT